MDTKLRTELVSIPDAADPNRKALESVNLHPYYVNKIQM